MNKISSPYRIIASLLAFLMLLTSVGFAVDMHYCQGQLKSVSLFSKAKPCHEKTAKAPMKKCPHHQKMMAQEGDSSFDIKDCCSNQTFHFQFDQDQEIPTADLMLSKDSQQFIIAYLAVFLTNYFNIESDSPSFTQYKPPLILKDIPVLIQSFLL